MDSDAYCMASCTDKKSEDKFGRISERPSNAAKLTGGDVNLIELVLLAKLNTLFPAVVALEKVGGDPPEFNQLVPLQALRQ